MRRALTLALASLLAAALSGCIVIPVHRGYYGDRDHDRGEYRGDYHGDYRGDYRGH
jgi:hypothetical protein